MNLVKLSLVASLIASASLANASDIKYGVQLGFSDGGDVIVSDPSYDLKGGSGSYFGAFAMVPAFDKDDLHLKLAINYFADITSTSYSFGYSEEYHFSRLPIDALLTKQVGRLLIGGGITYHLNTEFRSTINGDVTVTDVDDPLGIVLEANFRLFAGFNIGARYTNISYNSDVSSKDIDGSNTAFTLGYTF